MNETQFLAFCERIWSGSDLLAVRIYRRSPGTTELDLGTFASSPHGVVWRRAFRRGRSTYAALVVVEYATSVGLLVSILSFACAIPAGRHVTVAPFSILAVGAVIVTLNATNSLHHSSTGPSRSWRTDGLHMLQPEYGPLSLYAVLV
jgi:hypothetical protein